MARYQAQGPEDPHRRVPVWRILGIFALGVFSLHGMVVVWAVVGPTPFTFEGKRITDPLNAVLFSASVAFWLIVSDAPYAACALLLQEECLRLEEAVERCLDVGAPGHAAACRAVAEVNARWRVFLIGHAVLEGLFVVSCLVGDVQGAGTAHDCSVGLAQTECTRVNILGGMGHVVFLFLQWYPIARLNDATARVRGQTQNVNLWRLLDQQPPRFTALGYAPSMQSLACAGFVTALGRLFLALLYTVYVHRGT